MAMSTTTEHYKAYRPRPFTREQRESTTILFGGLHWRAERLLQGALGRLGYRTEVLPTASKEDLLTGRSLADIGQCCPTSFTTGNLANELEKKLEQMSPDEVSERYVYFTAGSCGSCRFGQYHQSYELALRNMHLQDFRMFLLAQDDLEQGGSDGGGLELNLPFTLGAIWAVLVSDLITDLEYQVRPYEVNSGETERVSRESVEFLYETFLRATVPSGKLGTALWYLTSKHFTDALHEVKSRFRRIEVDRLAVKPVVKITGEFYLQTVEGAPNYDIHRWLESEGAEVYPAAVTIWLDYLLRLAAQDFEDRIGIVPGSRRHRLMMRTAQRLLRRHYHRLRAALGDAPRALPEQNVLRHLASPYFHSRVNGGEGDMLVGKALWAHQEKKAHMICELSPYGCMPNTMSIGAMAGVIGDYPDLLYTPLEIKGDAEVHALSRCQMVLTEAKRIAQSELDRVLEDTGLTLDAVRDRLPADASTGLYRMPRQGAVGGAANLVLLAAGQTMAEPIACDPSARETVRRAMGAVSARSVSVTLEPQLKT
jgi:predicted nucleotide-binding protein (sugar kinase/HSP70/actin superfamily)